MKYPTKLSKSHCFLVSLIIAAGLVINPFDAQFLFAQETQKPSATKPDILLTSDQLKAFEGFFQSSRNDEMYVQFIAQENTLLAKLLWNNNEMHLIPESAFAFISKETGDEGPVHIRFAKDSSGSITQLFLNNSESWRKVKEYKPVIKKEMEHTPEQLKKFEGLYQSQNENPDFIQFTVKENSIVLKQLWDGNEIPFVPQSELDFFSRVAPLFTLTFTKDKEGTITQALAFKRDLWVKLKVVQPTQDQLKTLEGKYQFSDDKDNYIQLTSKNGHLIVKQLWDGKEIILEPQTATYFYNSAESYPLLVIKDKSGMVTQVRVLGNDLFNKVKE
jgi:hypothetical protein